MKKVGLVGGMGPESTIAYYRAITQGVARELQKDVFPPVAIDSLDLFNIQALIRNERNSELVSALLGSVENLHRAGADFAVLTANTAHVVFDELAALSPIPLLSIVEATCAEARRRGYKRLGLLGTSFTMDRDFYKKPFQAQGIDVVVPRASEREEVHNIIMKELEYGHISKASLGKLIAIILDMKLAGGIEALILGCTELPLILELTQMPLPCLDTVEIHVKEILRHILDD